MVFRNLVKKVFGDPNERDLKHYREIVDEINDLEPQMKALTDDALRRKTDEFKQRLTSGEELEDILPEAFAVVREASRRSIGKRHFDVQLIGGMVLHDGKIAEMKTGEGKTLVATLPLYLNALMGEGAHLVTPNDYLSKFGLQSMGPIYHALGLTAAVIQNAAADPTRGSFLFDPSFGSEDERYQNLRPITRREAYQADITYGTNNEFGFDYLRDNMVRSLEETVQRGHVYAIVDEVDNILIDEARTPLIISGTADKPSDYYGVFAKLVRGLKPSKHDLAKDEEPDGDYVEDLQSRSVYLSESGIEKIERGLRNAGLLKGDNLYSPENSEMIPYLDNSLRASVTFQRDKDYMVEKGQVIIVDEFTGRAMYGRRFSEGLHQAIEAKEGVEIQRENLTLATITFQNYFRLYDKLAGMTGTAMTEADEFLEIYKLDVVAIPTHMEVRREDFEDLVFMTERAKWNAIVTHIKERHLAKQPILIGTVAIETSERLSKLLEKANIPHKVLNAKQHEREATIIAQAGRPGSVTIATNMAGRGVDILLGGNPEGIAREKLREQKIDVTTATPEQWKAALKEAEVECARDREIVVAAGGLLVVGTERHEARRIDNQLRGRSGRQGDPGASQFYLSMEDDLMKRFGGDRVKGLMQTLRMPEDEPIRHNLITKSIQQAQTRVEGFNFDIRKRVLEYDDVVNKQRTVIYDQRHQIIQSDNLRERLEKMIADEIAALVEEHMPEPVKNNNGEEADWDPQELYRAALALYPVPESIKPEHWEADEVEDDAITLELTKGALEAYQKVEDRITPPIMRLAEREVLLRTMDQYWIRHLTDLDILREGIGLMAYAQRDPLVEYKREAYLTWEAMQDQIKQQVVRTIYRVEVAPQVTVRQPAVAGQVAAPANGAAASDGTNGNGAKTAATAGAVAPVIKGLMGNVRNVRSGFANSSAFMPAGSENAPTPNPVKDTAAEPAKADVWSKVGRNDPCPCGSGKKFKNCHYPILREQQQTQNKR
ncbi:MAG: preprotein translocase subunit SecA [Anaerolineae bacterium]|nr:preprotein translocase subunit SecA [Anaerolineae bacterium]